MSHPHLNTHPNMPVPGSAWVPDLIVTDPAAEKVWSLIAEEGDWNLKLRVYITGGGCSGFQYGFTFDDQVQSDDYQLQKTVSDKGTVVVLIDCMSYAYLAGAEIDYEYNLQGERFVIRNPHAKTTCGCGSSFSLEEP